MSITDLGANAAQSSGGDGSNGDYEDEYERFDLDGVSFGRQHPTTAVRGTAVATRKLWDDDNPDRADVAVILDDPEIVTSEAALDDSVVVLSDEESDQFKVVNLGDDDTKQPSDEMIDFDGNTYYGEVGTEFGPHDRIALKRGGGAGRRIASVLDVNGATSAREQVEYDDDGNIESIELDEGGFPAHSGGLVEYHPEDESPYWRYARDPEIRPDVEGQEVVIMVQRLAEVDPDYNGDAYWATVFANFDDDRQTALAEQYASEDEDAEPEDFITELDGTEFIRLDTTDEFEPSEDLLDSTGWIDWVGIDSSDPEEIQFLNARRVEEDFGSIWVPEGLSVDEATPEGVDVETDPTEDELDSEDTITAFGKGAPEIDTEEAEA